ncbi:Eco57I restriction-modification methylase domain-containing protein [Tabrizicola fusiformis]|uniref:Eco57I restriction-modification methylase domain-containing protein n=1 Tax=Tabrizicola sp. SY72 TaxID=2741673 RepID=UPI0019D64932|nr:hypothetical protein [Tabrizicola sp. SY72]
MAFDQPTRNRLQRFVTAARSTLEEEFTRQLQNDYGMDPASGTVAQLASLRHIDDQQCETARILRDTLAHYCAGEDTDTKAGLDRIVREQAFTVLNRLAALRMAEARGLLIESVGNGYQAKGFQLYARLVGTGLGETGDAYRVYLQSVFDELSQDLPGLFDRFSPQDRLFPREAALIQVLNLINHGEIEPLWAEDETIGWIYQYFNSKEERKAMREASQAPRNSRELAVRNQFFTPRYVVEFLVDNTLGRLWFNWTGGQTGLRDRCQYLLVKPDTVVLGNMSIEDAASARIANAIMKGQLSDLPNFDTTDQGVQAMIEFSHCVNGYDRDQSELRGQSLGSAYFDGYRRDLQSGRIDALTTQQIWDGLFFECRADRHGGFGEVYQEQWFLAAVQEIVARVKGDRERKPELIQKPLKLRDPRTIKLLDPACGSMHFGLYAFDLFLEIYREAWAWEQTHGPGCLDTETGGSADLKPLSQTYADQDAFLHDVPRLIIEHNIYGVDIDPRAAQIASLALWLRAQRAWHQAGVQAKDRPQVGQGHVVAAVAPPAEVDLRKRFMEELDPLDAELFEQTLFMLKGLPELGVLLQVEKELPALVRAVFGEHGDLFRAEDMAQWQKAEARLREALTDYARAARSTYQGRLFAEDALQGLRMIDHCREVFDVVVMNPPFGALASGTKEQISKAYPNSKNDLLAVFVERGLELMRTSARIGAITSRTCFFLSSFQSWRENVVLGTAKPEAMADMGHGVMDDAMVEAAAYVLEKQA